MIKQDATSFCEFQNKFMDCTSVHNPMPDTELDSCSTIRKMRKMNKKRSPGTRYDCLRRGENAKVNEVTTAKLARWRIRGYGDSKRHSRSRQCNPMTRKLIKRLVARANSVRLEVTIWYHSACEHGVARK